GDVDLVADREHVARVLDAAPGELLSVDESVRPTGGDESAEVADTQLAPAPDLALGLLLDQLLLHLVAALLQRLALRDDQPVAIAVDLNDFELQGAPDQARHLGLLLLLVARRDLGHL